MEKILSPKEAGELKLAELKAAYADLHAAYSEIAGKPADEVSAEKIASLEKVVKQLTEDAANSDVDTLKETIKSQNEEIATLEAKLNVSGNATVVEHNKKLYKVAYPKFNFEGKIYTAKDLTKSENAEVVERIIESKSGVLVLQEGE